MNHKLPMFFVLAAGLLIMAGVGFAQDTTPTPVEYLVPKVISERPHDPAAYIQGLLVYEDVFYESTGRYGASSIRKVDPLTGEVLQIARLNEQLFGEGLALVDDRLINLTWTTGIALVVDRESFQPIGFFEYSGEGWGLCYDGEVLYMSDGSASLFVRDPETFEVLEEIAVTLQGEPIDQLNELECVGDEIYANVWKSTDIMRIDKTSGEITGVIDASGVMEPGKLDAMLEQDAGAVLNGIAYDPEKEVFYITGKLWDTLYEVEFVPLGSD